MSRSIYLSGGTKNEQLILEDIIVESIKHRGVLCYYIPRELVGKDQILGEDRISKFKRAFGVEMYFDNIDGFDGGGVFASKFGIQIEQSATFTIAKRTWKSAIGRYGATTLPDRPCEGDLIYFPLPDSLLEIKFVEHQAIFYQIGKLYTYSLQVETFQYGSEFIDTGISAIDAFESLKSYDIDPTRTEFGGISEITIDYPGTLYTRVPDVKVLTGGTGAEIEAIIEDGAIVGFNIVDGGYGFNSIDDITMTIDHPTNPSGTQALAHVSKITTNVDMSHSYGDNNKFKKESKNILFSEDNPFGELK